MLAFAGRKRLNWASSPPSAADWGSCNAGNEGAVRSARLRYQSRNDVIGCDTDFELVLEELAVEDIVDGELFESHLAHQHEARSLREREWQGGSGRREDRLEEYRKAILAVAGRSGGKSRSALMQMTPTTAPQWANRAPRWSSPWPISSSLSVPSGPMAASMGQPRPRWSTVTQQFTSYRLLPQTCGSIGAPNSTLRSIQRRMRGCN